MSKFSIKKYKNAGPAMAGLALAAVTVFAATPPPTSGPAKDGSPAWRIQGGANAGGGRAGGRAAGGGAAAAGGGAAPAGGGAAGGRAGGGGGGNPATASQVASMRLPACGKTTICGLRGGKPRNQTEKVIWDTTLGYTVSYPITLPSTAGGAPGAGIDSKGNIWILQRNPQGNPQLFKYDKDYKLVLTVSPEAIGHHLKGHALAVDPEDNVWFSDADGSTVTKVAPDGKVLLALGTRGKRGDWDESKEQRLLWQPASIAFGLSNDVYIGEGHANESPNDVDSDDPANKVGAARVLHLTRDGKFINQWFGDEVGPGKFDQVHAIGVDPRNGDVWLGDREQYRFVIYNADGVFLKTIQMRNLTCGLFFEPNGNIWMSSGMDGQILKIDRDGKVLGAMGNSSGTGDGQFNEANYFSVDPQGNIYVGDTGIARVTKFSPPKK